jgi:hypothetical protein
VTQECKDAKQGGYVPTIARASAKIFACHGESDDPANRGSTNSFLSFNPSIPFFASSPSFGSGAAGTATAKYGTPCGDLGSTLAGVAEGWEEGRSSIPRKTRVDAEVGRRADWYVRGPTSAEGAMLFASLVVVMGSIRSE